MCFVLGVLLVIHGSIYAVAFLAIGIFYLIWFCGVRTRNEKVTLTGFMLIAVFFILWAIISATVFHYYHYSLAIAAYGLWALVMSAIRVSSGVNTGTMTLMIIGHGLALLGFLLVDLSWQIDTAAALAAITVSIVGALSAGFYLNKEKEKANAQA